MKSPGRIEQSFKKLPLHKQIIAAVVFVVIVAALTFAVLWHFKPNF